MNNLKQFDVIKKFEEYVRLLEEKLYIPDALEITSLFAKIVLININNPNIKKGIFHLSLKYVFFLLNIENIPDISINIADINGAEGRKNIAALKIISKLKSTKIFFKI